jgi:hypothetical protein
MFYYFQDKHKLLEENLEFKEHIYMFNSYEMELYSVGAGLWPNFLAGLAQKFCRDLATVPPPQHPPPRNYLPETQHQVSSELPVRYRLLGEWGESLSHPSFLISIKYKQDGGRSTASRFSTGESPPIKPGTGRSCLT